MKKEISIFVLFKFFPGTLKIVLMDIKGKVILITGASSGIGASTAKAFDRKGAKIAMAARRLERLNILAADMHESLTLPVDMSDELQARKMVMDVIAHFGRLDVLINNAACIIVSPAATVSAEDLLMAFHTNLTGPVAATQEAWTQMRKQKSGHIINIGSPGFMMGIPFYSPYVCSKAAFSDKDHSIGMVRSWSIYQRILPGICPDRFEARFPDW